MWGVLNVTPDSFSDGGRYLDPAPAVDHAERMLAEGASVIDIGGESSRPAGRTYGEGAVRVSAEEELCRVIPVLRELRRRTPAPISVDTVKGAVARAALAEGASIINDISGGSDPTLLRAVAEANADLVLMHNRGQGEVTAANTAYGDVVEDVARELAAAAARAIDAGVDGARLLLDPGIGFAKTAEQSLRLLGALDRFVGMGRRVLVGASRKSFIASVVPGPDGGPPAPQERLGGSLAAVVRAAVAGCHAVRVHDVYPSVQAVRVAEATLRWAG
ncbi:MAG: dihydropteroate synthase [Sandaracinaceae bacterium]